MIYVIDNGGIYSDQTIYFVDSDMTPEQVKEILATDQNEPEILFTTEKCEWFEGKPCTIFEITTVAYDVDRELTARLLRDESTRVLSTITNVGWHTAVFADVQAELARRAAVR